LKILVPARILEALCLCVLLIILTAGLWPFHSPRNDVSWLSAGNGLFLGKHGSLVSASAFSATKGIQGGDSCSLEIWLKPNGTDARGVGMVVAFYSPASQLTTFALRQYRGGLVVEHENPESSPRETQIYVGEVFGGERPVLVTITSSGTGTETYVDGILKTTVPSFIFSARDFAGKIIVGNAPSTSYSWSGQVKGFAIYDRKLSAGEVSRSSADWMRDGRFGGEKSESIVARYVFDEGKGRVVRNQVDSATNLLIPERFFVLDQQFLERPWDEFRPTPSYLKDVLINIVGFVPLGFIFYAYFAKIRKIKPATWLTVALGFATSLTIEVLQAFLPTRDSGMTDLITNTLGTALGVILFTGCLKLRWFDIAGVSSVSGLEKHREDVCLVP
jgi:VanZ family protein